MNAKASNGKSNHWLSYGIAVIGVCITIIGCSTGRYFNKLPGGTTFGQLLHFHNIVLSDSTGLVRKDYIDAPDDNNGGITKSIPIRYMFPDTTILPGMRTRFIRLWAEAIVTDSAKTMKTSESLSAYSIAPNGCGGLDGEYAIIFDSVAVNPQFPPGMLENIIHRPSPPTMPKMHTEMPPMFAPPVSTEYISFELSLVRLTDCTRILTIPARTDVFEMTDTAMAGNAIRQSIQRALGINCDTLMIHQGRLF